MPKERRRLPVQYTDDGWFLEEEALNELVEERGLAVVKENNKLSTQKMAIVILLLIAATGMVSAMAFAGATFWAFVLGLIMLADVKPVLKWLSKDENK